MAINIIKYVDITSGIGAGVAVARKEPIARIFSNNLLIPTSTVLEFSTADEVATYFGTTAEEYKRASFYFGSISKTVTIPNKISFYKYNAVDSSALIFGGKTQKAYTDFTAISDASFDLEIGGVTHTIITDLTSAVSLSDIALLIQTQIQLETDAQFATATVSFNATRGSFDLISGDTGTASISVVAGTSGTSISDLIEWNASAIFSDGLSSQTITENLNASVDVSTNFATFLYTPVFTVTSKIEVSQWSKLQNFRYLFVTPTSYNDAQAHYDALNIYSLCITLESSVDGEYHEMMPSIIAASTDYSKAKSVKNYMYQIFTATATVNTTAESNFLDSIKINYYGQTQTAGQNISFYQKGLLMGTSTDAQYANIFINEVWLKDSCTSEILNLQLALDQIPYNTTGQAQISTVLQGVIDEALNNEVISVGKTLSTIQRLYISQLSGDENAYIQVQSIGYWLNVALVTTVVSGVTEYSADYTLIYSKADVINKVTGTHVLV